jgi:hypothetical protein
MTFKLPTLTETREFLLAVGKRSLPDRNWGNLRSYHARRADVLSPQAVTQLHAHIARQRDVMPDTASDDGPIDRWGGIIGVDRKGATPARKAAAARVRGARARRSRSAQQLVASGEPAALSDLDGHRDCRRRRSVDADIVAIRHSARRRGCSRARSLEFVATPVGLDTNVVLQKDLDEDGFDAEIFGPYQRRVLASFSDETSAAARRPIT